MLKVKGTRDPSFDRPIVWKDISHIVVHPPRWLIVLVAFCLVPPAFLVLLGKIIEAIFLLFVIPSIIATSIVLPYYLPDTWTLRESSIMIGYPRPTRIPWSDVKSWSISDLSGHPGYSVLSFTTSDSRNHELVLGPNTDKSSIAFEFNRYVLGA